MQIAGTDLVVLLIIIISLNLQVRIQVATIIQTIRLQ